MRSSLSWVAVASRQRSEKVKGDPPDGGYGWVVVVASFFIHLLVLGNLYNFGLFFRVYVGEFNASHGAISWIGSIGAGLMTGFGAQSGGLSDRFGNGLVVIIGGIFISVGFFLASFSTQLWQLYLTQGLIAGTGYSLSFIAGVSIVGQWFTNKRGLAVGIAVAGSGAGQFGLALVIGSLLTTYNWRITLRYLALMQIGGMTIAGIFLRRFLPCFKRKKSDSLLKYFNDINFVYLYVGSIAATMGLLMPYTHLAEYAGQNGIKTSQIVLIMALSGIGSALGRVSLGFAADRLGKLTMLITCMALGGVSTLCWMACRDFPTLLIYFIIYNFFAGGTISLLPVVAAELFGVKEISSIIGVLYTGSAAGNLLSAPIGGFLYDAFGDYYAAIAVSGGLMITGAVVVILIDPKRKDCRVAAVVAAAASSSPPHHAIASDVESVSVADPYGSGSHALGGGAAGMDCRVETGVGSVCKDKAGSGCDGVRGGDSSVSIIRAGEDQTGAIAEVVSVASVSDFEAKAQS